jgi:hypothetical protein
LATFCTTSDAIYLDFQKAFDTVSHHRLFTKLKGYGISGNILERNSKMTTTAGHSFYIGPIVFFYNQVNDTGSWEPLVYIDFKQK